MKNHHAGSVVAVINIALTIIITVVSAAVAAEKGSAPPPPKEVITSVGMLQEMTLEDCLKTALENNHRRPASRFAVAMAEAQHRQALAGYWPQINAKGAYQHMDEAPNFLFPSTSISVPAQTFPLPPGFGLAVVGPGPAFPVVGSLAGFPAQSINVPKQDIKLMDEESFIASVDVKWLLYDGGMRNGYREQTKNLVEIMKQEARRTDLEITDSVKRFYYGAVLARQLNQVGKDTLARMEATLNLTETMYKEGSGKVKKTDFLDNKVMVETLRSAVHLLEKNEVLAQAALANTMGQSWDTSVKPSVQEIPYAPYAGNLRDLVSTAYMFSPDWAKLEAAIRASEGGVKTAKSGYFPKIALTGEVHRWWNDYNAGMATERNKEGWTVGAGMEVPIFDGFLTANKVREARARLSKIKEEKFLLREGIGLQVKDVFLSLDAAQKSYQATLDAMKSAQENRDLNTRAYQNELVETEKVIRAQLMEAFMCAQHYKTRFDNVALQSQLNLIVGTEVWKKLQNIR